MLEDGPVHLRVNVNKTSFPVRTRKKTLGEHCDMMLNEDFPHASVSTSFGICARRLPGPSDKQSGAALALADVHPSSSDSRKCLLRWGLYQWLAVHHNRLPLGPHPGSPLSQRELTPQRCTSGWRRAWACQPAWHRSQQWKDVWQLLWVNWCNTSPSQRGGSVNHG